MKAVLDNNNGKLTNNTIVPIVSDGACFPYSFLFVVLYKKGTMDIRKEIVRHVTNNWDWNECYYYVS